MEKRRLIDVNIQNVKVENKYMDMNKTGDNIERMMKIRQSNVADLQRDVQVKRTNAMGPLSANNYQQIKIFYRCKI
jgi:hypothetical protein